MKQCDYMAFTDHRCPNDGIYGNPKYPISNEYPTADAWIRTLRWCEEHKHEGDYLIEEAQNDRPE